MKIKSISSWKGEFVSSIDFTLGDDRTEQSIKITGTLADYYRERGFSVGDDVEINEIFTSTEASNGK